MQEKIFNEPLIAQFFRQIPLKDQYTTFKELILLGIDALNARLPQSPSNQPISQQAILLEIDRMKKRIEQLAAILEGQNTTGHFKIATEEAQQKIRPITIRDQNCCNFQKNIQIHQTEHGDRETKENITPKVTEVAPISEIENLSKPESKNKRSPSHKAVNRHHLDDSQVRKALTNPFAKQTPPKKLKKQKKYLYQEELDKAELKELLIAQQQEEGLGRSKRSKTSIPNNMAYTLKAESKIKDLVAKDRMKYKEVHNTVDYQKYEYSSEDDNPYDKIQEQEYQSSANQQSFNEKATIPNFQTNKVGRKSNNQTNSNIFSHNSSSFNKQQRMSERKKKKSNRRNKEESSDTYSDFKYEERNNRFAQKSEKSQGQNQNEGEDDLISQSSSFSKFSLGSQREVGKIGVRR